MPYGDGTGPGGMGPMSGRRGGFCAGFRAPGFFSFIRRIGRRRSTGQGRGFYPGMRRMRGRSFGVTTGYGRW